MPKTPRLSLTATFISKDDSTNAAANSHRETSSEGFPRLSYSVTGQQRHMQATIIEPSTVASDSQSVKSLRSYVVQQGDTADSLSRKFCSRPSDIKKYNGLDSRHSLIIGQSILLPSTSC